MAKQTPDIPQDIQERLNKTPAERRAELLAKRQARLDAMTPGQRQEVQDRIDRIDAVPITKRPTFMQASRLAMTAKAIKARVDGGMLLGDVIDGLNVEEQATVDWLVDQVVAARST